jgi:hypothetical protein
MPKPDFRSILQALVERWGDFIVVGGVSLNPAFGPLYSSRSLGLWTCLEESGRAVRTQTFCPIRS